MPPSGCDVIDAGRFRQDNVFDIICFVSYDSVVKFKLSLNFRYYQYGHQMWSRVIFETERETETQIPQKHDLF